MMAALLAYNDAVDIGHGRGRLAPEAARSLWRIDAQLGRPADVNEAWRSPEAADANYRAWVAYQNGTGPKAPYALPASQSIHCRGYAVDSDDWYNAAAAQVWRDNGWRQTARYPGTSKDEPWHGEYSRANDKYYGQASPAGGVAITMDWDTFRKFLTRALRYHVREFGDGADSAAQGPTLWERLSSILQRLDFTEKGGGWFPFRDALSRWLTYHSRVDGPEGKGRTIHEALDQIEKAVKSGGTPTVTVKVDPSVIKAALLDPEVLKAQADAQAAVFAERLKS